MWTVPGNTEATTMQPELTIACPNCLERYQITPWVPDHEQEPGTEISVSSKCPKCLVIVETLANGQLARLSG